jgi:hypothetical protein
MYRPPRASVQYNLRIDPLICQSVDLGKWHRLGRCDLQAFIIRSPQFGYNAVHSSKYLLLVTSLLHQESFYLKRERDDASD